MLSQTLFLAKIGRHFKYFTHSVETQTNFVTGTNLIAAYEPTYFRLQAAIQKQFSQYEFVQTIHKLVLLTYNWYQKA